VNNETKPIFEDMKSTSIIQNNSLIFTHNPFGGLTAEEIEAALVPRINIQKITAQILDEQPKVIELVGKKGRGKTTHLKYLHSLFPEYHLHLLTEKSSFQIQDLPFSRVIFIDSIHHLNFYKRLAFFKRFNTIVLTTHLSRQLEYRLVRKLGIKYNFNGIEFSTLKSIILNRIAIASNSSVEEIKLNDDAIQKLLSIYKDDYRAIINYLYDQFQQHQRNHFQ